MRDVLLPHVRPCGRRQPPAVGGAHGGPTLQPILPRNFLNAHQLPKGLSCCTAHCKHRHTHPPPLRASQRGPLAALLCAWDAGPSAGGLGFAPSHPQPSVQPADAHAGYSLAAHTTGVPHVPVRPDPIRSQRAASYAETRQPGAVFCSPAPTAVLTPLPVGKQPPAGSAPGRSEARAPVPGGDPSRLLPIVRWKRSAVTV
mmetsp:Transcript_26271/g.47347  ORF Transcript_26271/g.47347 Transcript_26271/m.47347 type:complete len:200 (-) Transcript_26271:1151-1750(-)